jgi:site-specific DNA-methyltransferase (adenine-specific)
MKIENIKPYEKNAKKHPKKQVEQVAKSIKEFGFNQPIVIDKKGVIIVGHGRYEAAKLLGLSDVPVIEVELTEEQAKAYRLADNKLNESEWEMDLVIEELKGLSEDMLDLTGFDKDLIIEPENKDDEVPEVPEEPKSKLGDLYELGNHRVLCGDSTKAEDVERLMDGKLADMIHTDPPYNVDYGVSKNPRHKIRTIENDKQSPEEWEDFCKSLFVIFKQYNKGDIYMWGASSPEGTLFLWLVWQE